MSEYTPATLRAAFAGEMTAILPPGSMTPESAEKVAGDFADAWEKREARIEALEQALQGTQLWLMSFLTSADEPCLVSRRSIKEYAAHCRVALAKEKP